MKERIYIIAEVGNTHEGSVGLAKQFIRAAAACGVDAVKFQTHIFEAESLPDAPAPPYFTDESRREYFERTSFTAEQWTQLKDCAENEARIDFLSSPFSLEAVDLLEQVGVNQYKIPSGEVTNLPLLEKIAKTGKRVLLSSGMSSWEELDRAVNTLTSGGCNDLVILQCTSEYPCPPTEAGLNALTEMKERYDKPVGYSDHTMGSAVAVAAVALGAEVLEKHFTLSRDMYGSDAAHSSDPKAFRAYVDAVRDAACALRSQVDKDAKAKDLHEMKRIFEKSIVAVRDLEAGATLSMDDLAFKKPGTGISAARYQQVVGKKLRNAVSKDHLFAEEDFE